MWPLCLQPTRNAHYVLSAQGKYASKYASGTDGNWLLNAYVEWACRPTWLIAKFEGSPESSSALPSERSATPPGAQRQLARRCAICERCSCRPKAEPYACSRLPTL